jgi:FG-GAP-like repeat
VVADVNNDGWVDLISANTNANTLTVLTNNSSGGFVVAATLNTGNFPDSLIAADVNGDGGLDLISANFNDNTLTVWTNTPAVVTNTVKHFVISWPWPSTGYVLQQTTNLATANWTTFNGLVSSNSTSMSVIITPATGNLFFRLSHP